MRGTEDALLDAARRFRLGVGDVVELEDGRWQRTTDGWELLPENDLRVRDLRPEQAAAGTRIRVTAISREQRFHWDKSADAGRLLGRCGTIEHLLYAGSEHAELDVSWDEPAHWLMLAPQDVIEIEHG